MSSIKLRTVDFVVIGDGGAELAAAFDALRGGRRVLIVLRSGEVRAVQTYRRRLRRAGKDDAGGLTVITHAEVVCVDGVDGVEAVVIRHSRTGRLEAVNLPHSCHAIVRLIRHLPHDRFS
jgi:thioredoxin reductase